jgi:glucose-6-phosphate 1-dehydrogenase
MASAHRQPAVGGGPVLPPDGEEAQSEADGDRALLEAMEGDHILFMREDNVDRAWEVMMPAIENPPVPGT